MIVEFQEEFARIAAIVSAEYQNKNHSELERYVQNYDFALPLINLQPIISVDPVELGEMGQLIYNGKCSIQMLTKAVKSDNFEVTKDVLIDKMIVLASDFFWELNKNELFVFNTPMFRMSFKILRQYTANFLVGVDVSISFNTSFPRLLEFDDPQGIPAPTAAAVTCGDFDSIDIEWAWFGDNATEFQIERSVNGGAWALLDTVPINQFIYTDNDVDQ